MGVIGPRLCLKTHWFTIALTSSDIRVCEEVQMNVITPPHPTPHNNVASCLWGSANERYYPTPPHPMSKKATKVRGRLPSVCQLLSLRWIMMTFTQGYTIDGNGNMVTSPGWLKAYVIFSYEFFGTSIHEHHQGDLIYDRVPRIWSMAGWKLT